MKTTTAITIFSFLIYSFSSCNEYQRKREQEALNIKIQSEIQTGIKHDTIFLGLRFGMTKGEVSRELNMLKREGKISLNKLNQYEYTFDFSKEIVPYKGIANLSTKYFNNKLYQLFVEVTPVGEIVNTEILQLKLVTLYMDKYSSPDFETKSLINQGTNYTWIEGNRMIKIIQSLSDVRIIYTDLVAKQEKEKYEIKSKTAQQDSIKNDI